MYNFDIDEYTVITAKKKTDKGIITVSVSKKSRLYEVMSVNKHHGEIMFFDTFSNAIKKFIEMVKV